MTAKSERLDPRTCGICALPYMVKNPHPDAGKPDRMMEVGTTYVCVPCTVGGRHQWSRRALKAEMKLREIEANQKEAGDE